MKRREAMGLIAGCGLLGLTAPVFAGEPKHLGRWRAVKRREGNEWVALDPAKLAIAVTFAAGGTWSAKVTEGSASFTTTGTWKQHGSGFGMSEGDVGYAMQIKNLTPSVRMNIQNSTPVRQTKNTSFGEKLKKGLELKPD
jgi:hypothetical protein